MHKLETRNRKWDQVLGHPGNERQRNRYELKIKLQDLNYKCYFEKDWKTAIENPDDVDRLAVGRIRLAVAESEA